MYIIYIFIYVYYICIYVYLPFDLKWFISNEYPIPQLQYPSLDQQCTTLPNIKALQCIILLNVPTLNNPALRLHLVIPPQLSQLSLE